MEKLLSWKRVCFLLISVLIVQAIFLFESHAGRSFGRHRIFKQPPEPPRPKAPIPITGQTRQQNVWSASECSAYFPDLYHGINKNVIYWKHRQHTITQNDTEIETWRSDGAIRILIHENELRILENKGTWNAGGYGERALSILSMIHEAIQSATAGGEMLPTIETTIIVDDKSLIPEGEQDTHSVWAWASRDANPAHVRQWLVPDFGFYSAGITGSFSEGRRRARQNDSPFEDNIPQAVWRGVTWTNQDIRGALVDKTRGKYWANVKVINWETMENIEPMDEMCKYAFTIHTEGRSYSGRLQYLLNCDSLPIIHDLAWQAHFYHLLVPNGPNQNYIPVKRDWSDLQETVEYYLDHPDEARRIINNSLATFRESYLSNAATNCYLRKLIEGWSSVSEMPKAHYPAKAGEILKRRGISFEAWVHLHEDYLEKQA